MQTVWGGAGVEPGKRMATALRVFPEAGENLEVLTFLEPILFDATQALVLILALTVAAKALVLILAQDRPSASDRKFKIIPIIMNNY